MLGAIQETGHLVYYPAYRNDEAQRLPAKQFYDAPGDGRPQLSYFGSWLRGCQQFLGYQLPLHGGSFFTKRLTSGLFKPFTLAEAHRGGQRDAWCKAIVNFRVLGTFLRATRPPARQEINHTLLLLSEYRCALYGPVHPAYVCCA